MTFSSCTNQGHCSTVVTLDLSNNMIRSMHPLRRLGSVAKGLQNLNLSNNDIKMISEVNHLRTASSSISRLLLQNNVCVAKYSTQPTPDKRVDYEKVVRKIFPNLKELDGVEIKSSMPLQPQPNHVPQQFAGVVTAFVTRYMAALNEPNRPNLQYAFFDRSMFSLTVLLGNAHRFPKAYVDMNRNLKGSNMKKGGKEVKTLLFGAAIAPALQAFPTARYVSSQLLQNHPKPPSIDSITPRMWERARGGRAKGGSRSANHHHLFYILYASYVQCIC